MIVTTWLVMMHASLCASFATLGNFYNPRFQLHVQFASFKPTGACMHSSMLQLSADDSSSSSSMDDTNFNTTQLSDRIQQMKVSESEACDKFTSGLNQRVRELQSASEVEKQFDQGRAFLPVISLDALLPNQKLEGSTQDPTFIKLLIDLGLGGWFVMTSLDFRQRKLRRNGVLCKIEFIDAAKKLQPISNSKFGTPASIKFVIAGKKRCRVVGSGEALALRIGRWRRDYDENGEEVQLGWGEERFLDLPNSANATNVESNSLPTDPSPDEKITDSCQWTMTEVECDIDQDEDFSPQDIQKAESLIPMIDEWYNLASNMQTYKNTNVTATTRVQRGQPLLSVEPDKLLLRVLKDLGERPPSSDPTSLAFWAAALINPLPPLGVSLEIRGKLLETFAVEERLKVLEFGLVRSIQNLKGERPL